MMKQVFRRAAALLSTASLLLTAVPVQASAETADKTPGGVAFSDLQTQIESKAEGKPYAAYAAGVFHGDETVFTGYYGEMNIENHIAASEDSAFEWGSISKLLTWVSVLQLEEQGKIDLTADIRGYLPEGYLQHLRYDDPITMMNLMNHTGGWCESVWQLFTDNKNDLRELGAVLQGIEPAQMFRPGEVQSYSNYGATLAAYIVERMSGESYVDYVHHNILEPLGMEYTAVAADYSDNAWVQQRHAELRGYIAAAKNKEGTEFDVIPNEKGELFVIPYACGGVCGKLTDLMRFGQALVDPAAPLFADPKTQEKIFRGSMFHADGETVLCCYGFFPNPCSVQTYFHNGQTENSYALLQFDPVSRVGGVFMTNTIAASAISEDMIELLFGKMNADQFAAGETSATVDPTGFYNVSRNVLAGIAKFYGSLTAVPIIKSGDNTYTSAVANFKLIGKDLYLLTDPATSEPQGVASVHLTSDGKKVFQMTSQAFVQDDLAVVKMFAVLALAVICAVSLMLLIINLFKRMLKKHSKYTGSGWVMFAQFMKGLLLLAAIFMLLFAQHGISNVRAIIFAAVSVICALVCAITVCSDCKAMFSKNPDKAKAWRYIFNILFNAFAAAMVVCFEMYSFWM